MLSILRRGPWSFNEWMCSIHKWTPDLLDEELGFIPFWVQVRGIPMQFLTRRMVIHIGEIMGHYLDTDFQIDGMHNVDYVRVKLLWNTETPLRFQRLFQFGDTTVALKFRYEKLRGFCTLCGMMNHSASECPTDTQDNHDDPSADDNEEENDDFPPGFDPPSTTKRPEANDQNSPTPSPPEGTPQKSAKQSRVQEIALLKLLHVKCVISSSLMTLKNIMLSVQGGK